MTQKSSNSLSIAIVLASIIIGGSVYMVFKPVAQVDPMEDPIGASASIPKISPRDHILGNPNAPIVIVEYTDLECPYCRGFHDTMKFLMDEYGKRGEVAWVVRHFPIPQLHPKAPNEHQAAECAAELGGNDAFFAFIDKVFYRTPSNNGLDPELLPVMAGEIGLNKEKFMQCLASNRHAEYVQNQAIEAFTAGAQGTPYNVVFFKNERLPVPGAQPYQTMRSLIDALLARHKGKNDAIPTLNI